MSDASPNNSNGRVENASLRWDEDGQPLSNAFDDIYFSKANGLHETRHVFLQHNQLEERFRQLKNHEAFCIGETGFGSGLNFLAAWALFRELAPPTAHLHFVSAEKFPLTPKDLSQALALWPELTHLSDELIRAYPQIVNTGFYRLTLDQARVHLTLLIDDAAQGFEQLLASNHPLHKQQGCKVDAWFLDGFAPSKNPQMWSDTLFDNIAHLSHQGTTAATFSAAGIVKQGLRRAGFRLEKVKGFGKKREMIKGYFEPTTSRCSNTTDTNTSILQPSSAQALSDAISELTKFKSSIPYESPWSVTPCIKITEREAIVIGSGIAGCHTARTLAERGWRVHVLEKSSAPATAASGNPQGILYAKLSPKREAQALFNELALQFAQQTYRPLWPKIGERCGVIQLANSEKERTLHNALFEKYRDCDALIEFVSQQHASDLIRSGTPYSGAYFPESGWIDPRALCTELLDHPLITLQTNCNIQSIGHHNKYWSVKSEHRSFDAPVVILATAESTHKFLGKQALPLKTIRGQVTYFASDENQPKLKTAVCGNGYVAPAFNGQYTTGATFNLNENSLALNQDDQDTNYRNLSEVLPEFSQHIHSQPLLGRAAFRCSLPDYLPMVGPVANEEELAQQFDKLRKNANAPIHEAGSYLPGLYVNIGHGSRGLAYTPIAAELLASMINNEPLPLPRALVTALSPARFIIRDIIRNKR